MERKKAVEAIDKVLKNKKIMQTMVDQLFAIIDTDKSGGLDPKELEEFLVASAIQMEMGDPPSKASIKALFNKLDINGDKVLSKEELGTFVKEMLEEQKKMYLKCR
eukprot:TRINITY_DN15078_c0_g1_i8.p2 TRINITY_DN15078_c0_g1~~TRINITY_DN15078_c0_g1_i8.p2  ORF type:complete len:106 (+),score=45.23 TRINITY_DN15078_c0_g1_i8:140-457(+)